ncbi:hypothetical protein L4D09_05650 [Photobacterium makurazakiensis]|uniref:hypothetical protein n=1 Tax=Photobacterium makurazakiensis TaxID=2910234 RepID=UPI003D09612D
MRLGRCMLIGLLVGSMATANGTEVSELEVSQVLTSPIVQDRVAALTTLYDHGDFRALEFKLSQLSDFQQEAVRSQLVSHAVDFGTLDQAKADWLQAQAERKLMFNVVEQGDGYLVTQSAFHYGAQARGLVLRWQQTLLAQAMVVQAEAGELVLSEWLRGDLPTQTVRRDIFLAQLPSLSAQAVTQLAAQFSTDSKLVWLPDNAIIAALAAASDEPAVYHLLWRRRSDHYSVAEVQRLAQLAPQSEAIEQLMAATINPSLKQQAYRSLVTLNPLPAATREFLRGKLDEVDDGQLVAFELANHGYLDWLEQLALVSSNKVFQRNFEAAVTKLP